MIRTLALMWAVLVIIAILLITRKAKSHTEEVETAMAPTRDQVEALN